MPNPQNLSSQLFQYSHVLNYKILLIYLQDYIWKKKKTLLQSCVLHGTSNNYCLGEENARTNNPYVNEASLHYQIDINIFANNKLLWLGIEPGPLRM